MSRISLAIIAVLVAGAACGSIEDEPMSAMALEQYEQQCARAFSELTFLDKEIKRERKDHDTCLQAYGACNDDYLEQSQKMQQLLRLLCVTGANAYVLQADESKRPAECAWLNDVP